MLSRPRHRLFPLVLALCAIVAARVLAPAQENAPAPGAQAPADPYGPPTQNTELLGQVPIDIRGTWVIVSHGGLPSNRVRNTVEIYKIDGEGNGTALDYQVVKLPDDWKQGLDEANKAFKSFTPTDAQLAELARSVDRLEPGDTNAFIRHQAKIIAPSHFAEAEVGRSGISTENSVLALRIQHAYRPGPAKEGQAQLMSDEALFIVQKAEPTRLEGDHSRIVLAAGFLPIPVVTQGPFTMYRLRAPGEQPPASSALARIWDALTRGCK
jgi:hypothetical protein